MKIRELEVNQVVTIPLVVKSVTTRETKAKKPYLALEFYDGTDSINGNYWDWTGQNIPPKNAVLDVKAQVTEWQGTKQLNVKGMTTNAVVPLSSFMPNSGVDIMAVYAEACTLMSEVQDMYLRTLAMHFLETLKDAWLIVPGAKGVHHAYAAGTLIHSTSVAKIAKAISSNVAGANVDMCTVGAMLHDIGKLYTYKIDGVTIDMTDKGMLYDHLFIGAELLGRYETSVGNMHKLEMLRHIVLSHHGKLEYGAVVTPMSIEAHIVYAADLVDASAEQIRTQSSKVSNAKWTERIWALDNRPHLSTQYVADTMESCSVE